MPVRFEIEFISKNSRPYHLIARHLTPGQYFSLDETPFLNGFKLKPGTIIPRASDKTGLPRFDLFVFHLADNSNIGKFKTGMIVELNNQAALT